MHKTRESLGKQQEALHLAGVNGSTIKGDWYCPNCETYIADSRVTFEECCDVCGTECEWRDEHGNIY
jgi:hypothetical protein